MSNAPKDEAKGKKSAAPEKGFTEAERTAMKERAKELKAAARRGRGSDRAAAEAQDVLSKIAEMPASDRAMAKRVHAIVTTAAPDLAPKLWYGQPGYAKDGKVVCFFRSGLMDKARYSTLGFSEEANLDDASGMWPTSFALVELTSAAEALIAKLVKQAAS